MSTALIITGIVVAIIFITVWILIALYRIVDPSEAHLVATPTGKFVASSDENIGTQRTYFDIPGWVPFFGRSVRIMDLTIKEIPMEQETIEKNQARFSVRSSTKYRINDVKTAAETYITESDLKEQLKEIVRAGVRAITVQYDVVDARAKKREIEAKIREEIVDDLKKWGLSLENFQLVEFKDTPDSKIISNISKRSEVEIESRTREQNAEKIKQARVKEAESDEKAQQREIERDRTVGEQKELMKQKISEKQKSAEEKRFEVVKVQTVKQAEITKAEAEVKAEQDKTVAIIKANQDRDAEKIMMEQKRLEGEGDRKRAEEQAKGEAAPIKEIGNAEAEIIKSKGLAEAEAKEKLQAALNKFDDKAIRALVAEKIVAMQQAVGIESAKALSEADVKVFAGGGKDGENAFDLGKMISSMAVSNDTTADAVLNKIARPNDLGLTTLGLNALKDESKKTKKVDKA
jgi:flotillin